MMAEGLSEQQARSSIWMVDSHGLVHTARTQLEPSKQKYAQPLDRTSGWSPADPHKITLEDVVNHVHPTILLGTGAQPGAFTEAIVRKMAAHVTHPIIFPLSNPTSKSEAVPADLLAWTEGKALVATGSPFPDVLHENRRIAIGQCNNAFIFPGVGLGVVASRARRVTDRMFVAAAQALKEFSPALRDSSASLYPRMEDVRKVSRSVAIAVALEAQRSGLSPIESTQELMRQIDATIWTPHYVRYRRGYRQAS
jgi:malate dehydrogenase (oxaloacetate-decarboxylating)